VPVQHRNARRCRTLWRLRYDSLELFSPRSYSALPGLPLAGDPEADPAKDEIAEYLERYARTFDLPVILGEGIARLVRRGGGFRVYTSTGQRVDAAAVIVAAGAFQQPIVPGFAEKLAPQLSQFTASSYRRPAQLPGGHVLVVGDGATGRHVSREPTATHEVYLSAGRPRWIVPQRLLGFRPDSRENIL
jgi:putative flavoprotein involved in K+ transport